MMPLYSQNVYKLSLDTQSCLLFKQERFLIVSYITNAEEQLHLKDLVLGRTGPQALCPYPTHMENEGFTCVTKTILCTLSTAPYLIGRVFENSCLEAY